VFKEIGREEIKEWMGPVNYMYITMVEAFKEGPNFTVPLRICMNSSLRQPRPVSMSLNNCLMKGPSALVNLFTLTTGTASEVSDVVWREPGRGDESIHHHHRQLWGQAGWLHCHRRGQRDRREILSLVPRGGLIPDVPDI
jgi:hypothetical protein